MRVECERGVNRKRVRSLRLRAAAVRRTTCTCSTKAACTRPTACWARTCESRDGVAGVRFAVWAPNAERVSVVGDFNRWDGRVHPMPARGAQRRVGTVHPGLAAGALYKFEIRNRATGAVLVKTDPYAPALRAAARHRRASCRADGSMPGTTRDWMAARAQRGLAARADDRSTKCMPAPGSAIPDGRFYSYRELADAPGALRAATWASPTSSCCR